MDIFPTLDIDVETRELYVSTPENYNFEISFSILETGELYVYTSENYNLKMAFLISEVGELYVDIHFGFKNIIKNYINKIYRKDGFVNEYLNTISAELGIAEMNIANLKSQLFFDKATDYGLKLYERDLGMTNTITSIPDRRQNVQAYWTAVRGKKFKLSDIQNICNAWENGRVTVDFINGVIVLTFNDIYGRPSNLDKLLETIENIKPAHLPLKYNIRYHTYGEVKKKTCGFFKGKTYKYIREGSW